MKIAEYRKRKDREERERKKQEQEVREHKRRLLEEIRQNPTTETIRRARERMRELEKRKNLLKRQEKNIEYSAKEAKKQIKAQRKVVSEEIKRGQKRLRERLAQRSQKKEGSPIEKVGAGVVGAIDEISIKIPETVDNSGIPETIDTTIEHVVKGTNKKAGEFFSNTKEKGKSSEAEKEKLEPTEAPIGLPEEDMEMTISPEKKKEWFPRYT